MFDDAMPPDTVGLAPVWSMVMRDSGRRADVIGDRFRDPALGRPSSG